MTPDDVWRFWFGQGPAPEPKMALWFGGSAEADQEIRARFGDLLERAGRGELDAWRASARGRLALVLVLDQFTRQAYRGTPRMFAHDAVAREVAKEALAAGDDQRAHVLEAAFLYLPLEHSESLADQDESVRRYAALAARSPEALAGLTAEFLDYARRHQEIVARFGRFPHRNAVLGRSSTDEELEFLKQPGSSF